MEITVDILIQLFKLMLRMGPSWSMHQQSFGIEDWDGTTHRSTIAFNGVDLFQIELREYYQFKSGVKFTQLVSDLPESDHCSRSPLLVRTEIESILG